MSTRPNECGYCGMDHGSGEPCPALDGPTVHYFNRVCQALCGSSNHEDGDAPAADAINDVTCPACLRALGVKP
jgi:hypothetical protein